LPFPADPPKIEEIVAVRSAVRALAGAQLGPARLIEYLDAFVEHVEPARWATLA
jgi:serine/threonine-protein kinase RsbW